MAPVVVRGRTRKVRRLSVLSAMAIVAGSLTGGGAGAQADPRIGLAPGWLDAATAASDLEHLDHIDKPAGFVNPANPGDFGFVTSDLAFSGTHAFMGNFNGFNIFDISDPSALSVVTSVVCPGGQGDVSVHGNLLFMSVEESRLRVDCGIDPTVGTRFQGVRIFDVSDVTNPVQVAAVQLCRGSHTHSLVTSPDDPDNVYVYVSGTAGVRPASTLAGCNNNPPAGENPSRWRIEVIKVPLAAPQTAAVVSEPRIFTNPVTGALDGLQNAPPTPNHPSGAPWGPTPITDACHDITSFPEIGLAAGACEGNGILIDISDPANPERIAEIVDPNFAYWHSATFNNDGTKVIFTDEWGGGTGARCRVTDQPQWGADAIYDIVGGQLQFASYFKLPVPQTLQENCVSHNVSLVPVPGRDILVQAWYQGGISMVDFTDSTHPVEIGFFDRGPINATSLVLGGFWAAYWYNGNIFGSEIARGLDAFGLSPSAQMSEAEIAAAGEVELDEFNPQHQAAFTWEPSRAVARALFDQLARTCTTTITEDRKDALVVSDITCLNGTDLRGGVTVEAGGSLLSIDSTIQGGIVATGAEAVHLYGTNVRGGVSIMGSTGSVALVDSTFRGGVTVAGNDSTGDIAPVIAANTINGSLACSDNSPDPINLGESNSASGAKSGQCAEL